MKISKITSKLWTPVFDGNEIDPWIPEVWAQESLMVLEANMVVANLVHRDFEDEIAQQGDTVNTRRPGKFAAKRKGVDQDVTDQKAKATNVAVKLDQHLHATFIIKDGEESKGMKSLIDEYLEPAVVAIGRALDEIVASQVYQFLANNVGALGTPVDKATVISAQTKADKQLMPNRIRWGLITPETRGDMLNVGDFTKVNEAGDDGSALRQGHLGMLHGTEWVMSQNMPSIDGAALDTAVNAINNGAGYDAGDTVLTTDGAGTIVAGQWVEINGKPYLVTAATGGPTTEITIDGGLFEAVADDDVVTSYVAGAIDLVAGYVADYDEGSLVIDGFAADKGPQKGQLVTFGDGSETDRFGSLTLDEDQSQDTDLMLDILVPFALADDDLVGVGPAGNYNWVFHRNCVSLVTRPLAQPRSGTGALSAVVNFNNFALRVTITYDGKAQGHRVTVDVLCGVKLLDINLGLVMFG